MHRYLLVWATALRGMSEAFDSVAGQVADGAGKPLQGGWLMVQENRGGVGG